MALYYRGSRGVSSRVGAFVRSSSSISMKSRERPISCSTRFKTAVAGGSDSAESTTEVAELTRVGVETMSSSTVGGKCEM